MPPWSRPVTSTATACSTPQGYAAAVAAGDLDGNGVLDSADEIDAALVSGTLVDDGIVKYFVCTLNKVPARH